MKHGLGALMQGKKVVRRAVATGCAAAALTGGLLAATAATASAQTTATPTGQYGVLAIPEFGGTFTPQECAFRGEAAIRMGRAVAYNCIPDGAMAELWYFR